MNLEDIVFEHLSNHRTIDTADLATVFHQSVPALPKTRRAARTMAAAVLQKMAKEGKLEQFGEFGSRIEDGGPYFTLPGSSHLTIPQ